MHLSVCVHTKACVLSHLVFTWSLFSYVFLLLLLWLFTLTKLKCLCVFVFFSASPLLTWRDVQHIIVKTSRAGHLSAPDWKTNAAGYNGTHRHSDTHTHTHTHTQTFLNRGSDCIGMNFNVLLAILLNKVSLNRSVLKQVKSPLQLIWWTTMNSVADLICSSSFIFTVICT